MGERTLSRDAFKAAEKTAKSAGPSVTFKAEQVQRDTGTINPLVDPAGHGVIRRSISRKDKRGEHWILTVGTAMAIEFRLDTTSSMGENVDLAFSALPKTYSLLAQVPKAVLGRYDTQICNSIFNDVRDRGPVLCRTQYEMDIEIARQLTMMIPVRQGGDIPEDPQYGMFASAYLTSAEIHKLGLKSYDFTVTDADAHGNIEFSMLKNVFGDKVMDKVRENGHQMDKHNLPQMGDIIRELLKRSHAFVLSVRGNFTNYWQRYYGNERVVDIYNIEHLPHFQAAIIGLTEGTLNLQNLEAFLTEQGGLKSGEASQILKAVAGIPIGAQTELPNFNKIPMAGDRFANKTDLWPMADDDVIIESEEPSDMWK